MKEFYKPALMPHLIRIYVRSPYLLILTEFSSTPPLVPSDSVSPDGRSKIFPAFTDSDITADCEGWHPIICIKINSWVSMSRVYFRYFRSPSQSHIFPLRATNNNKRHTHTHTHTHTHPRTHTQQSAQTNAHAMTRWCIFMLSEPSYITRVTNTSYTSQ